MSSHPLRSPLRPDDPRRLGRYTLAGRLGRGAQGVVYLARTRDDRLVALKLLHSGRLARPGARKRLAEEAATARRVRGKCTARVLDVDISGPRPYIVSEYVAGPSLHRRVRERGPLGAAALDRLMVGSATALVAIHSAGIVHRDLKPANVLLGPEGPRVIDFGVAHAEDATTTLAGAPVGTPAYMAPEQVAGEPAGCPADVFAWASTMVYAATGRAPFGRDNPGAVMNRIANHDPELAGLRDPLRPLLLSCLHKDPKTRPSAETVLRHLLELGLARPPRRRPRLPRPASPRDDDRTRRPRPMADRETEQWAGHDAPPDGTRTRPRRPRAGQDASRAGRARARARPVDGRAAAHPDGPRPWQRSSEDPGGRGAATPSPARRRGYAAAVIVTILVGLTLGILYPWANPDGASGSAGSSATPTASTTP